MSAVAGKAALDSTAAIIAWLGALSAGAGGNVDMKTVKASLQDPKIRDALGLSNIRPGGLMPGVNQKDIFDKYGGLETKTRPKDKPVGGGTETETAKPDPKDPRKKDPPDGPDLPKPPLDPRIPDDKPRRPDPKSHKDKPTEIPINKKPGTITHQKNPQWYSEYKFGGQDILKLTDIEKLEEIRNWTLFDLVNPHLKGDPENLLNIQNEITENRRFHNTYENPKPDLDLKGPISNKYYNNYHFRDQMPIDYPFRESSLREQQYYDNFSDQEPRTNDYLKDLAQRGLDPDFTQIANSKRRDFTADDKKYRRGEGKSSLVEAININKLVDVDYLIA
jgi:hypothetical protein